jgi:hypothetical protein
MELNKYKDLSGSSGVTGYKSVPNGIILQFKHKELYLYDNSKPGKRHVEQMKILAERGKGLTTYVNQNIRSNYKEKLS